MPICYIETELDEQGRGEKLLLILIVVLLLLLLYIFALFSELDAVKGE